VKNLVDNHPIRALITICAPVVKIFEFITKAIVDILGGTDNTKASLMTDEEIRASIKIGEQEGGIYHKEKYRMLSRVFDLSESVVKSVMTSRKDVVAIDIKSNIDSILNIVLESGYSRIPVYENSPDNIIGVINMKDLLVLSANRELVVLQDIVYSATFIPDSKKVTELLKEFQKGHTHLAIVTDVTGRAMGIITLEDILEEIVGEIEDEYDVRHKAAPKITAK